MSDGISVQDFWAWAYSDVLSNRNRSVFAEFLVASALNLTDKPRVEWDAVDLRYQGKKIEVKSSAYLQSWRQSKLHSPRFEVGKRRGWDAEENIRLELGARCADCYVFCVYAEKDVRNVDVLNIGHWQFYVVGTTRINEIFVNQKSVSLSRVRNMCESIRYENLKQAIERVLASA